MTTLDELQLLAARLTSLAKTIEDHTTDLETFLVKDVYYQNAVVALAELIEMDSAKLTRLNRVLLDILEDQK